MSEPEANNFYMLVKHLGIQPSEYAKLTPMQVGVLVCCFNDEMKAQEDAKTNEANT